MLRFDVYYCSVFYLLFNLISFSKNQNKFCCWYYIVYVNSFNCCSLFDWIKQIWRLWKPSNFGHRSTGWDNLMRLIFCVPVSFIKIFSSFTYHDWYCPRWACRVSSQHYMWSVLARIIYMQGCMSVIDNMEALKLLANPCSFTHQLILSNANVNFLFQHYSFLAVQLYKFIIPLSICCNVTALYHCIGACWNH